MLIYLLTEDKLLVIIKLNKALLNDGNAGTSYSCRP
jgi:hypothetical protein